MKQRSTRGPKGSRLSCVSPDVKARVCISLAATSHGGRLALRNRLADEVGRSGSTVSRWARQYRLRGVAALMRRSRSDEGRCRAYTKAELDVVKVAASRLQ